MRPVRFLQTSDWQLGMRRHFLKEEALPRYMQARVDAITRIGELAKERECDFVAVCGDVFESNQVDRRTVGRALEALANIACPVFLLPGNHDPYNAGSVYKTRAFNAPRRVHVLTSSEPIEVRPGVEVAGAPWTSKRPGRDLVAEAAGALAPFAGVRVLLGHGSALGPKPQIDVAAVQRAIAEEKVHFLALGDRHSATEVADRIWYSGTPEPTGFDEADPGHVLAVEIEGERCTVEPLRVGRWAFARHAFTLRGSEDVAGLADWLFGVERKETTVVRLDLDGVLSLKDMARLDQVLADATELFAALEPLRDVALQPDEFELSELGLAGFARATAESLASLDNDTARDALALLHRLAL